MSFESPYWVGWAADSWGVSWGYDANDKPIEVESRAPGGHWKHLFRAIRAADAHEVRVKGAARCAYEIPETFDLRLEAFATTVSVSNGVRTSVVVPTAGVEAGVVRARVVCAAHRRSPKCAAHAPYLRHQSYSRASYAKATAGCEAHPVAVSASVYHTLWTPKTVQNPTDEMLLLLAA